MEPEELTRLQSLAALGQMGAGIIHEMRNVMTGILGFAQVAQRHADEPRESLRLVEMIEQETQRGLTILSGFLELAHPAARERVAVDLGDVVRSVARLSAHQLSLSGVRLELDLPEPSPSVRGQAGALRQVLLNLTLNAMQAMQPGGGVVRMALRAEGDRAVISVADEGPGIAEAVRERLFEAFATTRGDGTGLGLFVSRQIVEEHGGTIEVVSEPGRGATFTITLPTES